MARFNKIYAGPWRESMPQVKELPAAVALLPGSAVVVASGEFAYATAATVGKVWFVQDNYLMLKGVEDAIAVGDVAIGIEGLPEQLVRVRVPTGQNLVEGDALTPGASGVLIKAGVSDMVVATAAETYNNNTGSTQLVQARPVTGYMTPAA
jgi:hypothetical protein